MAGPPHLRFVPKLRSPFFFPMFPRPIDYGGIPPLELIPKIQQPLYLALFLGVGIVIALVTGRPLVRESPRVSPLEPSRRVTQSDGESVRVRFGLLQFFALLIGGAK